MNAVEQLLGPAALARRGEQPALVSGDEKVSYADLALRVRRSGAALRALGAQPGARVVFVMRDTPEFAAAWLGAVRAGAVAVALNNRLAETQYRHILADSQARLMVVDELFALAQPDLIAELSAANCAVQAGRPLPGVVSWEECVARASADEPAYDAPAETPAFWLYSSGTTGQPKGIVHTHRAITCAGAAFRTLGIGQGQRVFTSSKFFFAYGLEHALLAPLALGATSIVYADWPDAEAVIDITDRYRPAAIFSVPTLYRRLLAEPHERLAPFRAVHRFVAGGERLSRQLSAQWRDTVGGEILNLYGMSETFCACIMTPPGTSDGARTGKPLDGVEVKLLDAQGEEPRAPDPGVLWVRHPAQAREYANLPRQTREQFRDGWFCSLDLFVRDAEGFLVHQGRTDELIKIAGQWVQPGEIEEIVARESAVLEAACVPLPDAEGLERLALFVTPRNEPVLALEAATRACERALPGHKRPKWVRAVSELPRTATGKVQRFKLREILERELARKD